MFRDLLSKIRRKTVDFVGDPPLAASGLPKVENLEAENESLKKEVRSFLQRSRAHNYYFLL